MTRRRINPKYLNKETPKATGTDAPKPRGRGRAKSVSTLPPVPDFVDPVIDNERTSVKRRREAPTASKPKIPKVPDLAMTGKIVPLPLDMGNIVNNTSRTTDGMTKVFRHSDFTHVSDLLHKCPRMLALIKRLDIAPTPTRLWGQEEIVFDLGESLHTLLKRKMIHQNIEYVYGGWSCRNQCEVLTGLAADHYMCECSKCGHPMDEYHEYEILDKELGLSAHIDLLFYYPHLDAFHVQEIKSINGKGYEDYPERNRAMPDHWLQTRFYWFLLRRAGKNVIDSTNVIYGLKDYQQGKPVFTTVVLPMGDMKETQRELRPYLRDLVLINAIDCTELPKLHSSCKSIESGEAKYCPVAALCFCTKKAGGLYEK